MTVEQIREEIEKIKASNPDDEAQHGMEDDLYLAVLTAIANGALNPTELAREAIKTQEMEFRRHCA